MRVPSDPDNPTYDNTFTVGFWRWFTSSAAERKEWARRRRAAIHTSSSVRKLNRAEQWARDKQAAKDAERAAKRQAKRHR
jgi:hypothetical protein